MQHMAWFLLGIWLSITLLYFPTSTFIKTFSLFSRQWDMSKKGTSAIYKAMYYLELLCEACHRAEASRSFNTPSYSGSALLETREARHRMEALRSFNTPSYSGKCFVGNTFGTPVRPPWSLARDRGLRVTKNTFLWVLSTHKNFTENWRTLGKSLRIIRESCRWLDLHPSYSLPFHEIMYKYEAEPPLKYHLFNILTSLSNWE